MVPKIIHYCWFGNKPIPLKLQKCIESWRIFMPDWEIIKWDEKTFDINTLPWTAEAYAEGKYAFVSDYVRLHVLYKYGGIYLDTDVKLVKSLEPLCNKYTAFMGFENKTTLSSAVISMPANHLLLLLFMEYYKDNHFTKDIVQGNIANVLMMTDICKEFGLKCDNSEQDLHIKKNIINVESLHVFPQTYFCPLDFYHNNYYTDNTYAIHYFDASWLDDKSRERMLRERSILYKLFIKIKSKFLFLKKKI